MIYVTGCSGFIGRSLVRLLADLDISSVGFTRNGACEYHGPKHVCISVDLLDLESIGKLQLDRCSTFVHLAWFTKPAIFWDSPVNYLWLNSTKRIIDHFFESGGTHFVNAGSGAEIGYLVPNKGNSTIQRVENAYSITKREVSDYLKCTYAEKYSSVRIYNLYGLKAPVGRLIPDTFISMLNNEIVQLKDPSSVRDYVFLKDVVEIFLRVIQSKPVGDLDLGTGKGIKNIEIVQMIKEITGSRSEIKINSSNADYSIQVADTRKLHRLFPFIDFTGIQLGLEQIYIDFSAQI